MEKVIFLDLSKKYYGGELAQNYFSLHKKFPNKSRFKPKNLETINICYSR